jgi:calcium-dependent protein kinase
MPRAGTLNYFSPEMIRGEYTELTDVFSAGIILYQLLTGVHPFYIPGVDDENSVKFKISKRDVEFPIELWSHISADAKDLTRKLLIRDPSYRLSAINALRHRWFKDPLKPTLHGNNGGGGVTQSIFDGLREYNQSTRLKQILLKLLARELTEIQTQDLRKKFLSLDKSGDGKISKDDLVSGMRSLGLNINDIGQLLPTSDGGNGGEISYNEFLAALSERKVKYGKTQLREAFKKLDLNNSGVVGLNDLKTIIRNNLPSSGNTSGNEDHYIQEVLLEAGIMDNGLTDGLSFSDFSDIITLGYITPDEAYPHMNTGDSDKEHNADKSPTSV